MPGGVWKLMQVGRLLILFCSATMVNVSPFSSCNLGAGIDCCFCSFSDAVCLLFLFYVAICVQCFIFCLACLYQMSQLCLYRLIVVSISNPQVFSFFGADHTTD